MLSANRVALALIVAFPVVLPAQAPPPSERLVVFEGTWAREGAPADGPREVCSWLAGGRRHLVCQTEAKTAKGTIAALRIHSYRQQTYVVHSVIGNGPAWTYTGGPEGDRWIFTMDRPNSSQRIRQVITPSQDRIRFVEESSKDNGPWETTEDYTMVKVK